MINSDSDLPCLYSVFDRAVHKYMSPMIFKDDEEAKKAEAGAQALFGGAGITADSENLPEAELHDEDFMEDGTIDILGILVKGGFEKSRNNARTSVQQGGVTVNDEKVTDLKQKYTKEELKDGILVRRGKKTFKKVLYR